LTLLGAITRRVKLTYSVDFVASVGLVAGQSLFGLVEIVPDCGFERE